MRLRIAAAASLRAPEMLCYQCEQTSAAKGCTTSGICSKTPQLAGLQDLQMAYSKRLCQLAHALGANNPFEKECATLVLESTFATMTNVNFDDDRFVNYLEDSASLISKMEDAASKVDKSVVHHTLPELPEKFPHGREALLLASGKTGLLARSLRVGDEDLFGVVEMATYGLKGVAAYLYHAEELGGEALGAYTAAERAGVYQEFFRIGSYVAKAGSSPPDGSAEAALNEALGESLAVGALNLKVMAMLDKAHGLALGSPVPTEVSTQPPTSGNSAILVSGHDMAVLHRLLIASEGKGVDVYTHGEMLPAHSYPKMKAFSHLRGHFGTHWGNQIHEFRSFPGAILMTSNCLRPPTKKYRDRLWTSGPVGFTDIPSIEGDDFSPLIQKALSTPAVTEENMKVTLREKSRRPTLLTGFGHEAVLGVADKVVGAIKAGELKNIFVIGGCDGTENTRSYFTDLAKETPADSLILTMGCGKFRLNDEDHGTLAGLPRLLDMGQCNDAYSAVVVASKLAEALGCGVGDLPLHFAVSWFEQKAVAVLLTLLHLELKNIRIGPAVPAFLTPKVVGILNEKFGLRGADLAHEDEDLAQMLEGN